MKIVRRARSVINGEQLAGPGKMEMSKKQRERATVEAFLVCQGLPASSLIDCDRESPDATVQVDGETIGIEITQVLEAAPRQPVPPQRWTQEAERTVSAARAFFERRYPRALVVSFQFRPNWQPPGPQEIGPLADELAGLVASHMPSEPSATPPSKPVRIKNPHQSVSWLYIGHTKQSLGNRWTPMFAGNGQPATSRDIVATVQQKEPKIKDYKLAARRVWLLIDCDLMGQGIALDVPTPSFTVTTDFDRVFCCGFGMWEWVEIPVINKHSQLTTT